MELLPKNYLNEIKEIMKTKIINAENGLNSMIKYPDKTVSHTAITTGNLNIYEDNRLIFYENNDDIISLMYEDIEKFIMQLEYHNINYHKDNFNNLEITFGFGKTFPLFKNLSKYGNAHYLVLINNETNISLIYKFFIDDYEQLKIEHYYFDNNYLFLNKMIKENGEY